MIILYTLAAAFIIRVILAFFKAWRNEAVKDDDEHAAD